MRQAGGGPVRYFIRDDDIGELTDGLKAFVELFVARGLPVSYQVIPERLTERCADFLVAAARAQPGLIEFGQHGLRHDMTVRGRVLNREFGPERPLEAQRADIVEGRAVLRTAFGEVSSVDLFTPPQHKFDRNTVIAAADAGHRLFSAAFYPSAHHQLAYGVGRLLQLSSYAHHGVSYHGGQRPEAQVVELSIAIDVDDGKIRKVDATLIPAALERATKRTSLVGLMFHHALYDEPGARAGLRAIADALRDRGQAAFALMGQLA